VYRNLLLEYEADPKFIVNFGFDKSDDDEKFEQEATPQLDNPLAGTQGKQKFQGGAGKGKSYGKPSSLVIDGEEAEELSHLEELKQSTFAQTTKHKDLRLEDQIESLAGGMQVKNTEIKSTGRSSKSSKQ
jgi:hypothetical protein